MNISHVTCYMSWLQRSCINRIKSVRPRHMIYKCSMRCSIQGHVPKSIAQHFCSHFIFAINSCKWWWDVHLSERRLLTRGRYYLFGGNTMVIGSADRVQLQEISPSCILEDQCHCSSWTVDRVLWYCKFWNSLAKFMWIISLQTRIHNEHETVLQNGYVIEASYL